MVVLCHSGQILRSWLCTGRCFDIPWAIFVWDFERCKWATARLYGLSSSSLVVTSRKVGGSVPVVRLKLPRLVDLHCTKAMLTRQWHLCTLDFCWSSVYYPISLEVSNVGHRGDKHLHEHRPSLMMSNLIVSELTLRLNWTKAKPRAKGQEQTTERAWDVRQFKSQRSRVPGTSEVARFPVFHCMRFYWQVKRGNIL